MSQFPQRPHSAPFRTAPTGRKPLSTSIIVLIVVALMGIPILGVCCLGGAAFSLIGFQVRSSAAYERAVLRAKQDKLVIQKLGSPVKEGWLGTFSHGENANGTRTRFSVGLSGPKGSGRLYVSAVEQGIMGGMYFERLELEVGGERTDLLKNGF